jgi:integrase
MTANAITKGALGRFDARPGRHGVKGAPGLKLHVRSDGRRYWTHRFRVAGRQTELSLGPYPETTFDEALAKYHEQRAQVTGGVDPIADKHAQRRPSGASPEALTFAQEAERFIERKESEKGSKWTNVVHQGQWRSTLLEGPVAKILGPMPIANIDTAAVLNVLEPMWTKTPATASRVRGRIQAVLDSGYVRLDIERANPARWKGKLDKIFSAPPDAAHHRAMPYAEIPAFMARLRARVERAARALEFLILTGVRLREALDAPWDEINWSNMTWEIPKERMKGREPHNVPLVGRMIEILREHEAARPDGFSFVFPGRTMKRPFDNGAIQGLLKDMGVDAVAHGFRSTFRDWVGEETEFPDRIAEHALAHKVKGVEGDYRRGDALKKRRRLMEAWSAYCDGGSPADRNVVSFKRPG